MKLSLIAKLVLVTIAFFGESAVDMALPAAAKRGNLQMTIEVPKHVVVVFSLDAGAHLDTHAFSVVAALSSVIHFSQRPTHQRFVILLTVPREAVEPLTSAMCTAIASAAGLLSAASLPMCTIRFFNESTVSNETICTARRIELQAFVTFVSFPSTHNEYPPAIRGLLELFCCSQRRYAIKRPELATSIGNHARFFAHLALLPIGVRRALFLDADILARVDVRKLYATQLTPARFIAAARRCAAKRAAYQPHLQFHDELVKEFGLKSNAMLVNAGVLLIDLEAYCNAGILDSLKAVLRRHISGPPLWRDGNNQPPFTIAAAKHISFVDPSWNVRLGDARGQAQVSRLKRKRHQFVEDECTAMLADPWILHAHFKPCDALPDHLCREISPSNSSSDRAKTRHTHDIAKNLKFTCMHTKSVAKRTNAQVPCQCADVEHKTSASGYRSRHHRRHPGQRNRKSSGNKSNSHPEDREAQVDDGRCNNSEDVNCDNASGAYGRGEKGERKFVDSEETSPSTTRPVGSHADAVAAVFHFS